MTDRSDEALPAWTNDELALLRSADDDRPRAQSLPAALAAVGAAGAIVSAAAGAQGATLAASAAATGLTAAGGKWTGTVAIAKWIAVAAVGATVVTGAAVIVQRNESLKRTLTEASGAPASGAPARRAPATMTTIPEATRRPAPLPAAAAQPSEHARQSPSQAVAVEPVSAGLRRAKRSFPVQPDISSELAALDAAMKTLRAGDATAALAALDRYDASFARRGRLQGEATAMRIEALARAGRRAAASALARDFLARHPNSPYAARIRSLLE
jgi:hypothetical protein